MMKKKETQRIIYWIHPHFFHWMGGHKYIYEQIKRLRKKNGYDVRLISAGFSSYAKEKFAQAGIPTISLLRISTNSPLYWIGLPLFLTLEKKYLEIFLGISPKDIVISSMFPCTVVASSLTEKHISLCYEPYTFFHDPKFLDGFSPPVKFFFNVQNFLYGELEESSLLQAKQVITLSEYSKNWIKKCYGRGDAQVSYEGVDLKFFRRKKTGKLYKKYRKYKIVLHATDYTTVKGTKYLIKALPYIVKKVPDTKLVITETIPNSPYKAEILKLIQNLKMEKFVEFAGFIPYKDLPECLSLAKVLVQPSIHQSMNLTVKEAMACETPVVISPEGREQTEDGVAGYLVSPKNTQILAKRIVYLLTHPKKAKSMGRIGRRIVEKKFSWDVKVTAFSRAIERELQRA